MKPLGPTQQAILDMLSTGRWVGGPEMAQQLGTNRCLIWHAIERLRWRGYEIEGYGPGNGSLGYKLIAEKVAA